MSPAGTSWIQPMWRCSSVMKDWQKRITSASLLPAYKAGKGGDFDVWR